MVNRNSRFLDSQFWEIRSQKSETAQRNPKTSEQSSLKEPTEKKEELFALKQPIHWIRTEIEPLDRKWQANTAKISSIDL